MDAWPLAFRPVPDGQRGREHVVEQSCSPPGGRETEKETGRGRGPHIYFEGMPLTTQFPQLGPSSFFNLFKKLLLLYWGYIVTFTKVLTLYHS
jgi:hypothetical protein